MPITSIKLQSYGGGGLSLGQDSIEESWSAVYKVCCTGQCAIDPRCMILEAFVFSDSNSDPFPTLGEQWPPVSVPANTCAGSLAVASAIVPGKVVQGAKNTCCWTVTVNYSIQSEDVSSTGDPMDVCPQVVEYEETEEVAVEEALFLGAYEETAVNPDGYDDQSTLTNAQVGGSACTPPCLNAPVVNLVDVDLKCAGGMMTKGRCYKPVNTAGVEFEEPFTTTRRKKGYRITYNLPDYDPTEYKCFEDTTNCEGYWLEVPCRNFRVPVPVGQGLMRSISGSPATYNGINYWKVTFDILIDPRGNCRDVLSRGYSRRVCKDDPVGHGDGETIQADPVAGQPNTQAIESNGFSTTEPVPLGLDGQPLKDDAARVRMRYCFPACTDHRTIVIPA